MVEGAAQSVAYRVSCDDAVIAEGELSAQSPAALDKLAPGEYLVTLTLPEHVVLTALNGNALLQRGTVEWMAAVAADTKSTYQVALTGTGSVMLALENITGAAVTLLSADEAWELTADAHGVYAAEDLLPGTYTVKVALPEGRYDFDASRWTLAKSADATVVAVLSFDVTADTAVELPLIARSHMSTVSGSVRDANGDALRGVTVSICDAQGQLVATAETGKDGAWSTAPLYDGDYSVQYAYAGRAIPSSRFTLSSTQADMALSATAQTPAKITVRAFIDDNNNGSVSKGEGAPKDVEIALVDEQGAIADQGVTGKDGTLTLSAIAGQYTLRVTAPADYGFGVKGSGMAATESIMEESASRTQQSAVLTLSTEKKLEAGVGLLPMATVRGTVWNDQNADGVWQEGEPGIPGIRLTLKGGKDKTLIEAYTDENGVYEFRQVKKGNYELTCYVPDEYVFTVKAKGDVKQLSRMTTEKERAGVDTISLERGEVHADHNIGMMEGAIIEGVCFLDANCNGYYDEGDQPLPGVELRLARQSNNVLLQSTVSGADGSYHFVGQRGSTFTIRANLPKGCVFTVTAPGDAGNKFAPAGNNTERRLTDVTLENGEYRQIMLGAVMHGSISGRVYFDSNFSSDWESGEMLGEGYTVTLWDGSGNKLSTRRTEKNGTFSFTNLAPGEYYLTMKPEKGYAFTALGSNNVMQTLADGTGKSRAIIVGLNGDVKDAGIGMIVPAIVTGHVFADENDNGLQDAFEQGLAGTVVRLMGERGEVASATLDGSGEYCFNAVLPGAYHLQYELPEHGVFAAVVSGGNTVSGENGVGQSATFSVQSGDSWTASLCGGLLLSDISGMAYTDNNGNGHMDADESAMPGMRITLTPTRSDLETRILTTGADGKFAFGSLRPDTYTLQVECPDGYVVSRLNGVTMPVRNGLATQETTFQLKMGTQWHAQRLGCVIPASWSGEAFLDENWDGLRGADEAPAVGETIELRDADTGETVLSVQTDEKGCFTIAGIAPGEYELVYPLDDGNLEVKDGSCDFYRNGNVMTNGRVVIREAEQRTGTLLCVARTTEIGGQVWLNQYSGVTPVKGARLHLLDGFGVTLAECVTGEDGRYLFKGLMPGEYAVDVTIPDGYALVDCTDTSIAQDGLSSFVQEAQGLYGKSAVVTLRMARHLRNMDTGMVLPGRLGDMAWLDLNGNGLQDFDEGGIPGVTIELLRGDKVVATTVTDQYGYYVFDALYPTVYTLRVTWPSEVKPTVLRTDVHQISSVLQEDGTSIPVTVESNKANYAADLGFVLVEEGKLPAGYGEGAAQVWKKK